MCGDAGPRKKSSHLLSEPLNEADLAVRFFFSQADGGCGFLQGGNKVYTGKKIIPPHDG